QLYKRVAGASGHRIIFGTPEQIVDKLESWIVNGAADGYNLMFSYLTGSLGEFVEKVIPILQNQGLFKKEYRGKTLREHLALPVPKDGAGLCPKDCVKK